MTREGFTAFSERRGRLERLLRAYGWRGTTEELLSRVDARLLRQQEIIEVTAAARDPLYQRMLAQGLDRLLESARSALDDI